MALEFLQVKVLSRGKSGTRKRMPAHFAYRSCTKIYDEQQKRHFNYTNKESVLDSFLINAGGNTLEQLANKMEAFEKRKDARMGREFILGLQHELDLKTNREICERFVDVLVKKFGVAAHVAIHKPYEMKEEEIYRSEESLKNIHAHITITERRMGEDGEFIQSNKDRSMNDKDLLKDLKLETHKIINDCLVRNGLPPLEKRDPNLKSERHMGASATWQERRGISTEMGEYNRQIKKINELGGQMRSIDQEMNFLRKRITNKGYIIIATDKVAYAKDDPVNILSLKSKDSLFSEIEKGYLKPKKWHAPGVIETLAYHGKEIWVSELLLARRGFTNSKLEELERVMGPKYGPVLSSFGVSVRSNEKKRELNINHSNTPKKKYIARYSLNRRNQGNFRKTQVTTINFSELSKEANNAFWHAKQAAYNIEKGIREESI